MFQPHSRRILCGIAMILAAVILVGCAEEEVVVEEKAPPPPPPTPEQIAAKIMNDLQINAPLPAVGSRMPKEASDIFLKTLRTVVTQRSASTDGKRALQIVSRGVDKRLRQLAANELWEHVLTFTDAHKILNPDSRTFDESRRLAILELQKPEVSIQGYFYDGNANETAVFMDFYLPIESETHRHQVRKGEEFYGLKLVGIIGNNQGVTMEYIETTQTFDVLNDSSRN